MSDRYEKLIEEQQRKLSELHQEGLTNAYDFLNEIKQNLNNNEVEKSIRIKSLIERLLDVSSFRILIDKEYFKVLKNEILESLDSIE